MSVAIIDLPASFIIRNGYNYAISTESKKKNYIIREFGIQALLKQRCIPPSPSWWTVRLYGEPTQILFPKISVVCLVYPLWCCLTVNCSDKAKQLICELWLIVRAIRKIYFCRYQTRTRFSELQIRLKITANNLTGIQGNHFPYKAATKCVRFWHAF